MCMHVQEAALQATNVLRQSEVQESFSTINPSNPENWEKMSQGIKLCFGSQSSTPSGSHVVKCSIHDVKNNNLWVTCPMCRLDGVHCPRHFGCRYPCLSAVNQNSGLNKVLIGNIHPKNMFELD